MGRYYVKSSNREGSKIEILGKFKEIDKAIDYCKEITRVDLAKHFGDEKLIPLSFRDWLMKYYPDDIGWKRISEDKEKLNSEGKWNLDKNNNPVPFPRGNQIAFDMLRDEYNLELDLVNDPEDPPYSLWVEARFDELGDTVLTRNIRLDGMRRVSSHNQLFVRRV